MRNQFLVTYDICHPRRLRKVYQKMHGFGTPVQYSVFLCPLSRSERIELKSQLGEIINHSEDRVMIVDLGPAKGRGANAVEFLGRHGELPEDGPIVI